MIIYATFLSLWDDDVTFSSNCKVNTDTKEVFDIVPVDVSGCDVEILVGERVIIGDDEFSVYSKDNAKTGEYWYK